MSTVKRIAVLDFYSRVQEEAEQVDGQLKLPTDSCPRINVDDDEALHASKYAWQSYLELYYFSAPLTDSVVQLAYWYMSLVLENTFWPIASADVLLDRISHIITGVERLDSVHLLMHHFTGFAAHILLQLADYADTKDQALSLLERLDDFMQLNISTGDAHSFDAVIRDIVHSKRTELRPAAATSPTMGLEHLANAAVNTSGNESAINPEDGGVAAAAEAAAKAAQLHMGAREFKGEYLSQEGYLAGLLPAQ
jgi:hypothetical protein